MADKIESIPEARLLLASLRSVGYNEEICRTEIPHFSEICRIEQYSIIRPPKYALDLP